MPGFSLMRTWADEGIGSALQAAAAARGWGLDRAWCLRPAGFFIDMVWLWDKRAARRIRDSLHTWACECYLNACVLLSHIRSWPAVSQHCFMRVHAYLFPRL